MKTVYKTFSKLVLPWLNKNYQPHCYMKVLVQKNKTLKKIEMAPFILTVFVFIICFVFALWLPLLSMYLSIKPHLDLKYILFVINSSQIVSFMLTEPGTATDRYTANIIRPGIARIVLHTALSINQLSHNLTPEFQFVSQNTRWFCLHDLGLLNLLCHRERTHVNFLSSSRMKGGAILFQISCFVAFLS